MTEHEFKMVEKELDLDSRKTQQAIDSLCEKLSSVPQIPVDAMCERDSVDIIQYSSADTIDSNKSKRKAVITDYCVKRQRFCDPTKVCSSVMSVPKENHLSKEVSPDVPQGMMNIPKEKHHDSQGMMKNHQ